VSEIPSPARREQGPATQAAATALPAVLIGLAVVLAAQTLGGQGAMLSSPETEHPCEYSVDILRVSLPGQAGQPAEIDFTSNDFATYKRNLGLGGDFGSALLGKRVLDVGAGLSDFVDVLTDTYGAEALAVDLAYAEVDLEGLPEECVDLFYRRRIAMDAQRILFPSNYFDLVVSHSLLKWFFLFEPTADDDVRERIQRGMDILGQMVRVTNKGGEVRTTDFPDPYGAWPTSSSFGPTLMAPNRRSRSRSITKVQRATPSSRSSNALPRSTCAERCQSFAPRGVHRRNILPAEGFGASAKTRLMILRIGISMRP
jgi:SAM-dependent methyltransferase